MKLLGFWTALGAADGAALGVHTQYMAVWIAIGAALGLSAGLFIHARNTHHAAEGHHSSSSERR
jgi:hypothetical protein